MLRTSSLSSTGQRGDSCEIDSEAEISGDDIAQTFSSSRSHLNSLTAIILPPGPLSTEEPVDMVEMKQAQQPRG